MARRAYVALVSLAAVCSFSFAAYVEVLIFDRIFYRRSVFHHHHQHHHPFTMATVVVNYNGCVMSF